MGGLLQLPSPPRRPRRPDTLRTTTPENPDPAVIDDRQSHTEWEDYYNYHRPHGGLGGQTPYERLRQKTQTRP
ncbi:integrase core domain-containing protein [Mycobacterium montefiorense]|uniref:integrase core domain-containing protein n=1 Tax=Mycobacterium montefiorense TaxID=154654 RepID=UPI0035585C2F